MNLLARRNLLFQAVAKPAAGLGVNVTLGSREFPAREAADPGALALKVRRALGDDRRSLRLFGSEVVIGRLAGDAGRLRIDLLNYGGRDALALRVRVRGRYAAAPVLAAGQGPVAMEDYALEDGATEFTIPRLGPYARVDLVGVP
jgi:hypothetical protein